MQVHVAVFDIVLLFLVQNLNNFLFTQQLGIAGFMKLRSVVPGAKMELCVRNSNTFYSRLFSSQMCVCSSPPKCHYLHFWFRSHFEYILPSHTHTHSDVGSVNMLYV